MRLMRNISITMATSFLSTGAAAVAALVVANALGAKGAGTFAIVRVMPTVVTALLGAGITLSNAYLVGCRKYSVQAITETSAWLGVVIGLAGWGGWVLCGGLVQAHFLTMLSREAVLVVGLSIPLQIVRNYLNSVQQGLQTFTEANVVLFIEDLAAMLFVLPLMWRVEAGPEIIVLASVGGSGLSCIAAVLCLVRAGFWPWPRLHRAIAAEAIVFGIKGHIGRIANMLNWRLDMMILSTLASVEVVGYYAVATKVAEAFRPLSASLTFVLRPLIASLPMSEARARGVLLYQRAFAINIGLVLVMAVVGGPLIIHLFGPEFAPAVPAFQILLVGLAAHGADGVLNGYNVGIGRPEFNTYTALVGLVITVVGDVTLIPVYSLIGAAVTSSVAYSLKTAALTGLFLVTSGVTLPQLVGLKEYSPDLA